MIDWVEIDHCEPKRLPTPYRKDVEHREGRSGFGLYERFRGHRNQ